MVALLSLAAGAVASAALTGTSPASLAAPATILVATLVVPLQLVAMYVFELYEMSRPLRAMMVATTIFATLATVVLALGAAVILGLPLGMTAASIYVASFCIGSMTWRLWVIKQWRPRAARERILVLGDRRRTWAFCEELANQPGTYVDFFWQPQDGFADQRLDPAAVVSFVKQHGIDAVTYPWHLHADTSLGDTVLQLRLAGLDVVSFPTFFGSRAGRVPLDTIDAGWISETLEIARRSQTAPKLRRIAEPILAAVLGIVLLPVALLVAVVIKLDSRGPALFAQERLGYREKPFRLYKFRTMVQEAERESGPAWAAPDDGRITRVGGFLRATGLDEIPQLINVVRGEMSFVGVRPIRRHFAQQIAEEVPFYWHRFFTPPGITGWAQVMHDYAGSVEGQRRKLEYELFYLRYASPILNLAILLKTVKTVLFRRVGAFIDTADGGGVGVELERSARLQPVERGDEEPSEVVGHAGR